MTAENVRIKPTKYRDLDAAACDRLFLKGRYLLTGLGIALLLVTMAVFLIHRELSFWLYLLIIVLIVFVFGCCLRCIWQDSTISCIPTAIR